MSSTVANPNHMVYVPMKNGGFLKVGLGGLAVIKAQQLGFFPLKVGL